MRNAMKFRSILFIGIFLLVSCSYQMRSPTSPSIVKETVTPSLDLFSPTFSQETLREQNRTIIPSSTTTLGSQIDVIQSSCLKADAHLPQDIEINGKILLRHQRDLYWWFGANQGTKQLIKNVDREFAYPMDPAISPDGNWLAYITSRGVLQKRWIIIEPSDSKIDEGVDDPRIIRIPIAWPEGIIVNRWLDPKHLVLIRQAKPFYSTIILNPFTGEDNEYNLETFDNYPQMADGTNVYFQSSNLMPDPTQRMIAYPQYDGGFYITLWDIQSKKTLVKLKDLEKFKHEPLWAISGSDFVIAINSIRDDDAKIRIHDWFQVNRNGTINRLTNFAPFFSTALSWNGSRSPNDQYLAFELVYTQADQDFAKWLIIDLQTGTLLDFCIESDLRAMSSPVWSPDSNFMLIGKGNNEETGETLLIDLHNSRAYRLDIDGMPVGWTDQP